MCRVCGALWGRDAASDGIRPFHPNTTRYRYPFAVEQLVFKPFARLRTWAKTRPTSQGRIVGYLVFATCILLLIPLVLLAGAIMAIGAMCSAFTG